MGAISRLFQSPAQKQRIDRADPIFGNIRTGNGALSVSGDRLNPIVDINLPGAGLRNEAVAGTRGVLDQVTKDIDTLRGLENPFIRSRVRPLEERRDSFLADQSRGLARRGVTGTLANRERLGAETQFGREIADQTTMAQVESLNAVMQRQGFMQSLNQQLGQLSIAEAQQALAEIGLGQQAIAQFLQSMFPEQTVTRGGGPSPIEQIGTLASGASGFMPGP